MVILLIVDDQKFEKPKVNSKCEKEMLLIHVSFVISVRSWRSNMKSEAVGDSQNAEKDELQTLKRMISFSA